MTEKEESSPATASVDEATVSASTASAAPAVPAAAEAAASVPAPETESSPPAAEAAPSAPAAEAASKPSAVEAAPTPAAAAAAASSPAPQAEEALQEPAIEPAVEAEDAPIDVEEGIMDDGDSAIADSVATYTTSLASSVIDYPVEYGRRYHAYQAGRYTRPNDEMEMDRLLITHTVITMALDGLHLAPVDFEKPQRILDIGTGSGVWAMEMADKYPNSTIVGNDLSANMPTFVPPNVKFEVDDVENDWIYDQPFSFIFSRYMVASINDFGQLIRRVFENLEPGGWAEFQDFNLNYYSEDGTLKDDNPIVVWAATMRDAVRGIGRDPLPGGKLAGYFEDAGFTNIVHRRVKLPVGPWAKDPLLKQVGLHNYMQISQGLEAVSMRLYTHVLKWTHEQAIMQLAEVRKQLQSPNIHPIIDFHVVYGQKPE
ncbi:hypothetical protein SCUCBS95973_006484 [Sporothrix curviconia]|uniref:Methyltransferase domain-containing protein n=1 Tax=Sporothrix curviconia TaxID=1260050 RepID=A0ABP0C5U3_9PEZI